MRGVRSSSFHKKSRQLSSTFWTLLTADHVLTECGHTTCNQVFSCKHFGDFVPNRREVFILHPSIKNPDSCQALAESSWLISDHVLIEWGHTSCKQVNSCFQQTRAVRSSSLHKMSRQLSSTFESVLLTADHVLNECDHTTCNQVFSCKQLGDFDLTDRPAMLDKLQKSTTRVNRECHSVVYSSSTIIDKFLSADSCLMSCWFLMAKSKSQWSTVSWVFSSSQRDSDFSKLTSSPNHPQLFSLEWWSMSCWFLEVEFNSQSWTNWLQACRWLQIPVIKVKWTGTGLVSQLNDTCPGQAPPCPWCWVYRRQACEKCMNVSTE